MENSLSCGHLKLVDELARGAITRELDAQGGGAACGQRSDAAAAGRCRCEECAAQRECVALRKDKAEVERGRAGIPEEEPPLRFNLSARPSPQDDRARHRVEHRQRVGPRLCCVPRPRGFALQRRSAPVTARFLIARPADGDIEGRIVATQRPPRGAQRRVWWIVSTRSETCRYARDGRSSRCNRRRHLQRPG